MTKERLEHLRLMADQCENLDPTDTRELLDEIERLRAIDKLAKEWFYGGNGDTDFENEIRKAIG